MSQDFDKPIEGHEYDGIQEFNNPLPGWWLVTFFGTIIFSFIYYIHYELAGGLDQSAELKQSLTYLESLKKGGSAMDEDRLAALFTDSNLQLGQTSYVAKCAVCHGPSGEGLIGPNLTDNHFIHGTGQKIDAYNVIANGVLDKGMPPWASQMSEEELVGVTYYVHKMKGQFVSGGRPPQGNEVK